jgi:hypothetical protein
MTNIEQRVSNLENKVFELETQLQVIDKMATTLSLNKIEDLLNLVAECSIRVRKLETIINNKTQIV